MFLHILKSLLLILFVLFTTENAYAVRLKIATLSPEGSMWMEKMRAGADMVAQKTGNRVTFKFYPGGVMGNDKTVLKKIRIGQLQGGAVVGGSLSQFFPANQLYAQPLKLTSIKEVDYVRKHMDQYIIDGLNNAGFVTFGIIGGGFAYIMSQNPINTVDDLRNQKVWIPDNDKISQDSIKTFGVTPIPLSIADVRTSLQTGLINTVVTSPVGAVVLQWHTQIKYIMDIPLIYLHAVLAVDKKKFLKIKEQDRAVVTQVMTKALKQIDIQNREDDINAIQALKNRGIKFITPSKDALVEWHKVAAIASKRMIESGILPRDVVDQLDTHLSDFHSNIQNKNDQ
ncbi:MAG: TRAP transporter substrate-binding protein DctP [Desulfobacula sp.]|jgi:TRAP-type C4-dicarboxylate transport system substrate-binding protein|uniref:TRAP transporter substrate-binding protein n=1 Tax=Desulfobacula sp. TaxID=2593537 RepID=UPI001DF9F976|nr:TRAP transporter substrate-binding protein DctP [Desulfobacula sp.]MBT3484949.1 TRAP transporter substrate-binding protein DctP [Desulfobacula sp.]MBT3803215.1 TRAP transporter substrate-binding protein DctP [Desulfobacula sp.]MBT4024598.1 TRAP transporter substrate-binding protein DctP [Desulfobacula sp.]MBT4197578.1 TRAP transporter substrate-binding protein DctP [Desulfobacula sp.]